MKLKNLSMRTKAILCAGGLVLFTGTGLAIITHENTKDPYLVENEFQNLINNETNYNEQQAYRTLKSYFSGVNDSKEEKANENSEDNIYKQGVIDENEARKSEHYDNSLKLIVQNRIYEYAKEQAVKDYQVDQDTNAIRLTNEFYFNDDLMEMLVSNASVFYMNVYNDEKVNASNKVFQGQIENNQYDYTDNYSSLYIYWLDGLETDASKEAMNESGFYTTGVMGVRNKIITEDTIQKQENILKTNQSLTTVDKKNTESYIRGAKNAMKAATFAGDDEEKYVEMLMELTKESAEKQAEKDISEYQTTGKVDMLSQINYQNNKNLSILLGTTYLSSYENAYQNLQTHTK
ncbi:MAG: hypothetical protein KH135_07110 [Firmicutes bacterium]|nr:hypothetical protein [Bacillota bacterium]